MDARGGSTTNTTVEVTGCNVCVENGLFCDLYEPPPFF
jgi:hypothetical protein